jgi:two-component system phosphate regulon sensor histidine kinase PhoR
MGLFLIPAISGFLLGEFFFLPRARETLVDQFRTELEREMGLGADLLERSPGASPDSLAGEFTRSIGFRVSIISLDGRVIGDSDVSTANLPGLENHADRPEVGAALSNPGTTHFHMRRSATLGVGLLYGARQVQFGATQVVLRIAIPLRAVDEVVGRLRRWFGIGSLSLLVLSILLASWLASRLEGPLSLLNAGVRRLSDGELDTRISSGSGIADVDRTSVAFNRLASELRDRVQELERERDEMETLINSIDEGILALTEDARVLRTNEALLSLLGIPRPVPFAPVGTVVRQPELRELLENAVVDPFEGVELRVMDRTLIVSSHLVEGRGAVVTMVDATEVRRLEKVRTDFVANASHELKTPLTSMRGFAETLLEDDPPEELRRAFLESIRNNSVRLQRLVDDLLDLSRLESGGWQAREQELEVAPLVREVWQAAFSERATENDVRFSVEGNAFVLGDERALEQILSNLFDNALRYCGPGGSLEVTIKWEEPTALICVEDSGSGIPSASLPRIFERFFRVDPARSRAEGGTGLGLAIVRHLMQAMGGEVWAESELGSGTKVYLRLPGTGPAEPAEPFKSLS